MKKEMLQIRKERLLYLIEKMGHDDWILDLDNIMLNDKSVMIVARHRIIKDDYIFSAIYEGEEINEEKEILPFVVHNLLIQLRQSVLDMI